MVEYWSKMYVIAPGLELKGYRKSVVESCVLKPFEIVHFSISYERFSDEMRMFTIL